MDDHDTLREDVRKTLTAYRDHLRGATDRHVIERRETGRPVEYPRDNWLVSTTQVESAMRVLWMD